MKRTIAADAADHQCDAVQLSVKDARSRSRWLQLNYVLAACIVSVLIARLYFHFQIVSTQGQYLRVNRLWSARDHQYTELARLLSDVNLPGNDVFTSEDPQTESSKMRDALAAFDGAMNRARADLASNVTPAEGRRQKRLLELIDQGAKRMAAEAEQVFATFEASKSAAGKRMAAMDRYYWETRKNLYSLQDYVDAIQEQNFRRQEEQHAALVKWEVSLDCLVLVLAFVVITYATILSRRISETARLVDRQVALLRASKEALRRETELAEQASRAKSSFLANMSHEIRTPMTAIMGYAESLLEPERSDEDRREAARVIRRNGRHLLELINDVLDISKIEAGKLTVERTQIDLLQVIADVASLMRPMAIAKHLTFNVIFGDRIPRMVLSDAVRIKQVMLNLISNALKFTESGGIRVKVAANVIDGQLRVFIAVIDTGIGISEEQITRIFEPFTQADNSTTRRFGGTGLGLAICKKLVELLGGELTVRSALGVGSSFQFTLDGGPAAEIEMIEGVTESQLSICRNENRRFSPQINGRILLAEDGLDNQQLLAGHLRNAGAEVVVADTGRHAVELALAQDFDLILMDMQMPELDGYAATSELRQQGYDLPIIALTAHAMNDDRSKCLAAGCTDYLAKPIEKAMLLSMVAEYLDRPADMNPSRLKVSAFADDPEMKEVIDRFVSTLPARVEQIRGLVRDGNAAGLRRVVHQLKGAGGGYGFDEITFLAGEAEKALKPGDLSADAREKVNRLIDAIASLEGFLAIDEAQYETENTCH